MKRVTPDVFARGVDDIVEALGHCGGAESITIDGGLEGIEKALTSLADAPTADLRDVEKELAGIHKELNRIGDALDRISDQSNPQAFDYFEFMEEVVRRCEQRGVFTLNLVANVQYDDDNGFDICIYKDNLLVSPKTFEQLRNLHPMVTEMALKRGYRVRNERIRQFTVDKGTNTILIEMWAFDSATCCVSSMFDDTRVPCSELKGERTCCEWVLACTRHKHLQEHTSQYCIECGQKHGNKKQKK